jgi:hypothetical protein
MLTLKHKGNTSAAYGHMFMCKEVYALMCQRTAIMELGVSGSFVKANGVDMKHGLT